MRAWIALFIALPLYANYSQPTFTSDFKSFLQSPQKIEMSENYRFVFIAGFLNEAIPTYFDENINALKRFGLNKFHEIYPTSAHSVEENIGHLIHTLKEIKHQGPEKLVILAHSKGGVEALSAALVEQTFWNENVFATFLIQAPIKGSGMATYFSGEGHPIDSSMPMWPAFLVGSSYYLEWLLDSWINSGLKSLTHRTMANYWDNYDLENHNLKKIYYITGSQHPNKLSKVFNFSGWYLHSYYGENDGIVEEYRQHMNQVGVKLFRANVSHSDYTNSNIIATKPAVFRHAFMYAIVNGLTQQ